MTNDITINGLTLKQWTSMMKCPDSSNTERALRYYDGHIEDEMVKLLDRPNTGRKQWRQRGFVPRYRNLVRPIITHSGMLFKDKTPSFNIYDKNQQVVNNTATRVLMEELGKTDIHQKLITLDETTRLVKTSVLLTEYDKENNKLHFTLLHKNNCGLHIHNSIIRGLIYKVAEDGDTETYRLITPEFFYDIIGINDEYTITHTQPNPFNIVPATVFHDTNTPLYGVWNKAGMDLVNANEMLNMHLTDTEYSLSWCKMPTLYTTYRLADNSEDMKLTPTQVYGQALPQLSFDQSAVIGGPGKAVLLDDGGITNPYLEYKAPSFDVSAMDTVIQGWIYSTAEDWSVRINNGTTSSATSGFQLLVEELPNRELRQLRQRSFEVGFKQWYKVVSRVLNTSTLLTLPEESELYVEFPKPSTPYNEKENEEMWSIKLSEGRASLVDYFVEVKGMSPDEARAKIQEIQQFKLQQP